MFFILSTRRCGTLSLANVLLDQGSCVCLHEPAPAVDTAAFRDGRVSGEELRQYLEATRLPMLNGRPYGEASESLALAVPVLEAAFPNARYVWLLRNGLDVVAEMMRDGEYGTQSGAGAGSLAGDLCGEMPPGRWAEMTAFEKCCWYWAYVNGVIEQDLNANVEAGRTCMVTAESLAARLGDLAGWLGLAPVSAQTQASLSMGGDSDWQHWSAQQWTAFEQWCGPLMDRAYPDWRALAEQARIGATGGTDAAISAAVADATALKAEGERRFAAGDLAEARDLFERALEANPDDAETVNDLGVCLWSLGRAADALLCFGKGLESAPDDRHLVLNAGMVLEGAGRHSDAEALYSSYLDDFPEDADVRARLEALSSGAAAEASVQAPTPEPEDAGQLNALGEACFQRGETEEAERLFQRALALQADHLDALNNIGVLAWHRGDGSAALDHLRRAMEVKADHPDTLRNLVVVLEGLGHGDTLDQVRQALQRVELRDSDMGDSNYDAVAGHAR